VSAQVPPHDSASTAAVPTAPNQLWDDFMEIFLRYLFQLNQYISKAKCIFGLRRGFPLGID
jgi:hypothetical protein